MAGWFWGEEPLGAVARFGFRKARFSVIGGDNIVRASWQEGVEGGVVAGPLAQHVVRLARPRGIGRAILPGCGPADDFVTPGVDDLDYTALFPDPAAQVSHTLTLPSPL